MSSIAWKVHERTFFSPGFASMRTVSVIQSGSLAFSSTCEGSSPVKSVTAFSSLMKVL